MARVPSDLLGALLIGKALSERGAPTTDPPVTLETIERHYRSYIEPSVLKPGDIVVWKDGMCDRNMPKEEDCAVVVAVYDHPPLPRNECTSVTEKKKWQKSESSIVKHYLISEPVTIALGVLDSDHDLQVFHFDRNRFRLAPSEPRDGKDGYRRLLLTQKFAALTDEPKVPIHAGDFVKWKPGLRNHSLPRYDDVCAVFEVLREPVVLSNVSERSSVYNEHCTLLVGLMKNEKFVRMLVDGKRFELVKSANVSS